MTGAGDVLNKASRWDEASLGPMTLESIRRLFRPESHYRVSRNTYPAGVSFNGWSAARRLYVITGACTISVTETSWELFTGDVIDLPESDFRFTVARDRR